MGQIKYIIIFAILQLGFKLQSQSCLLKKDDSLRLFQVIKNHKNCNDTSVIEYCLKYRNSKIPNYSIGSYYREKKNFLIEIPRNQNPCRLERFSTLFFLHYSIILKENIKKDVISLHINGTEIDDSYLNKGYTSEEEKKVMITEDIEESKKYDRQIEEYYHLLKNYLDDYRKLGENLAKKKYLNSMKEKGISWD